VLIVAAGILGVILKGETVMGQPAQPPLIVFVCEHGSAKSLVAASFLERMAKERGLPVRVVSRGTAPDADVPPGVVAALGHEGFDVASYTPRSVSDVELQAAARVVAIGVDLGEAGVLAGTRLESWNDIPPVSTSYPAARDAIRSRLDALLRNLEGSRADRGRER
jgi:arsenate reductase